MENKSLKYWKLFSIILIILNLALIFFLVAGPLRKPPRMDREGNPGNYLTEKLKFTEQQKTEFDKLREAHHDSVKSLKERGKELREKFYDGLKSNTENKITDSLSLMIAENQKQIELVTYQHFKDVKQLCTDEQKTIFNNIIQDVIEQMGRPEKDVPR